MTQFVPSPIFITWLCSSIRWEHRFGGKRAIFIVFIRQRGGWWQVIALFPLDISIWIGWGALAVERERERVIWHYRWYLALFVFFFFSLSLSGSNCGYGAFGRYCLVSRIVIAKGEGSYVFNTLLLCCDLPVRKVQGCRKCAKPESAETLPSECPPRLQLVTLIHRLITLYHTVRHCINSAEPPFLLSSTVIYFPNSFVFYFLYYWCFWSPYKS